MPLTLAAGVSIRPIADQGYEVGRGDVFFKLDEPAALVLTLFDGRRDASALRAEAARRGLPVSARSIDGLARALVGEGLLVDVTELPLEPLPETSVACARCGYCCHLSIGPLDAPDVRRLEALDWGAHGLEAPNPWLRSDGQGDSYLAQGPTGACVFLDPDGLCRVHKVFGEEAKPDPCRLFPLVALRRAGQVRVGLTYECPGLARAALEGVPVSQEVARLAGVVRRSLEGYAVLPDLDPDGALWKVVVAAPSLGEALAGLCDVVAARCPEGSLGVDGLLDDLIRLATDARDEAPSAFLRAEEAAALTGLIDLRAKTACVSDDPGPADELLLDYVRSQIFLGEPTGRLGDAAGVAMIGVTVALARTHPKGLAGASSGLRCVERVDTIPGAGARLVRQAVRLAMCEA